MAFNMYYKQLCKASDEPVEPLDPYTGNPTMRVPRETLSAQQLREMGKKAFSTYFHLPDMAKGIGTKKRIELINTTERNINETDPLPKEKKKKMTEFVTTFHIPRNDSMRTYAMAHYSLRSTEYLEHCRNMKATQENKQKAREKKREKQKAMELAKERADEIMFEEALAAVLSKENAQSESKTLGKQSTVPKLAWGDQTDTFSIHSSSEDSSSDNVSPSLVSARSLVPSARTIRAMHPRKAPPPGTIFFLTEDQTSARSNSCNPAAMTNSGFPSARTRLGSARSNRATPRLGTARSKRSVRSSSRSARSSKDFKTRKSKSSLREDFAKITISKVPGIPLSARSTQSAARRSARMRKHSNLRQPTSARGANTRATATVRRRPVSARPVSTRPASSRPAIARPASASAGPASAKPSSARPASARPANRRTALVSTRSRTIDQRTARNFRQQQGSPRSRSRRVWTSLRPKTSSFDLNPSASDWEN
uniref:Uncharacterized protein n=1 Tax=Lotharella globosa TaxID=91324 RepID=A0A7S3ZBI1_9EUKA|mmetsp:Transcript_4476/g.8738  ORF Transcript_4476/g.8738 Transcript_4476/m.8738 type:complete len:482 (+) Transcript_4476:206-1651(+)|eukprot:CAMPEP_0167820580 /NCGR_PEP_ID=MMETSP0112_2-20121227/6189_1 /TAXON_ID=91324 /ORGANISM="Lotharella globosa, Strain CCCM811" /LENGTH=481 /DNA_ID=CAMNT_0007721191 /DNA_START=192 /DNA_END=1637 /DNA_ORIENTATION=-